MRRKRKVSYTEFHRRLERKQRGLSFDEIQRYMRITPEELAKLSGNSCEEIWSMLHSISYLPKELGKEVLDDTLKQLSIGNTYQAAQHYGISIDEVMKRIHNGSLQAFRPNGRGNYIVCLK